MEEETDDLSSQDEKSEFQKELIYNKLLPYGDAIDEESRAFLAEIKLNLPKAVILRELRPGVVTWTGRYLVLLFVYFFLY